MKTDTIKNPKPKGDEANNDLQKLLLDELSDLLSAENQLVKALPKMIKAAHSEDLSSAIEAHLEETKGHVTRLNKATSSLGEKLKSKKCAAMEGLLKEASELLEEQKDKSSLDAAIIAAAQKVEHYEIASYGTVCAWAEELGHSEVANLLHETLDEEDAAEEKLTQIAEVLREKQGGYKIAFPQASQACRHGSIHGGSQFYEKSGQTTIAGC